MFQRSKVVVTENSGKTPQNPRPSFEEVCGGSPKSRTVFHESLKKAFRDFALLLKDETSRIG